VIDGSREASDPPVCCIAAGTGNIIPSAGCTLKESASWGLLRLSIGWSVAVGESHRFASGRACFPAVVRGLGGSSRSIRCPAARPAREA
jgi:hypothetical protein